MILPLLPHRIPFRSTDAFSLVEVAMALGIFAFATLGLMGLIPVAVTTHRDAKIDTVLAQIKQRLAAEVMLTDGAILGNLNNFERAFDVEGRELLSPHEINDRAVYRGKIVLQSYRAPGSPTDSNTLQRATIIAIYDPAGTKINAPGTPVSASVLVPRAENAVALSYTP